jgi:molybdenum ABC transporter molybdate-binding protein
MRYGVMIGAILMQIIIAPLGHAERLVVATAANFAGTAQAIAQSFGQQHPDISVRVVVAATAVLYQQIVDGAPYDIFLSADQHHIDKAVAAGLAQAQSRITYAEGVLVALMPPHINAPPDMKGLHRMLQASSRNNGRITYAHPDLAPYGQAAEQVLAALKISARPQVSYGLDTLQAYHIVQAGGADVGFVALSHVVQGGLARSSYLRIPHHSYAPILQDGAVIAATTHMAAAKDFMAFLQSADAHRIIAMHGYAVPEKRAPHQQRDQDE